MHSYYIYRAEESSADCWSTSDADTLSSSWTSVTIVSFLTAVVSTAPGWWMWRCRKTYRRQVKRREQTGHMYLGAPPCRISRWCCNELCRRNLALHFRQVNSSTRRRYLSGSRWGCERVRWLMRPASLVNCRPQPSHVCRNRRSCSCRWWICSVIALPSTLPHWSQRCSTDPRCTVEIWSFSSDSSWNVREQYSHTNDFCAWPQNNQQTAAAVHLHNV